MTEAERLELAQKMGILQWKESDFKIPYIHPKNIFVQGNIVKILHYGLIGIMEPMDLNEQTFLATYKALIVSILRPKLDFEINYGNDGKGYGIHYVDKNTDIIAVILTNSFFSGDYTKKLKIEKIVFFKGSPVVQYEKTLESQDIKLLKLKEIPKRILSLVCCMIEILSSEGNN